jgi:uncharacterized protein (TIGR02145 family)
MKKQNKFFNYLSVMMVLVIIFTFSCKKANTDPEISLLSLTDQDGNTYKTVEIGTQTWMAENLKTTRFSDNSAIPVITANTEWITLTTPGYCWYNNDEAINKPIYGALYNWYTVITGKLCPAGWHVPTNAEYDTLEVYLGIPAAQINIWGWCGSDKGAFMKSTIGWAAGENGTNTSGFTAIPGGYRYGADGSFNAIGTLTYWWSSTEDALNTSWYRRLDGNNVDIYKASTSKAAGKYIRCIKD